MFGLVALGVAERFVPVLPSYGVLVAIGIAASSGAWSVFAAIAGTVAGSIAGCLLLFGLTLVLSEEKAYRLLRWAGRLAGLSSTRVDGTVASFRAHQRALAFGMQLVPTVRLISPAIAGLFRVDATVFTLATLAGIVVWNAIFICVGHVAGGVAPEANASELAVKVLMLIVVAEATIGLTWRYFRRPAPEDA